MYHAAIESRDSLVAIDSFAAENYVMTCKCWTEFAAAYATLNATDVAQVEGAVNLLKKQCSTMSNGVSPKRFLVASMATLSAVLNLVVWSLLRSGDLELRAACA